jgi:hypothetical protein
MRQVFHVLADSHFSKTESRMFDRTYVAEEVNTRWIYPGMILAVNNDGNFVPYNAAGAYDLGSNEPAGVNHLLYDITYGNQIVSGIWHGKVVQDLCFVYGGTLGSISAAIKTALDDIKWV